jgi:hypothetical protein
MSKNRFLQTAGSIALTVVFALTLAACGGSDDDNDKSSSSGGDNGPQSSFNTRQLIGWWDFEGEVDVYINAWERDLSTMRMAGDTYGYNNYVSKMIQPNYLALRFIDGERVEYTTVITVAQPEQDVHIFRDYTLSNGYKVYFGMIESSIYSRDYLNADHYVVNGDQIYLFSSEASGNNLVRTLTWRDGKLYDAEDTNHPDRGYYKVSMRN